MMNALIIAAAGVWMVLAASEVRAQIEPVDTFRVTYVQKTPAHPFYGLGRNDSGYAINGVEGAELTFVRGQTYVFQMVNIPNTRKFYFSESRIGEGRSPWEDGVTGTPSYANRVVTFTPPMAAPALLYYQSTSGNYMGGKVNIVDSLPSSVRESDGGLDQDSGRLLTTQPNPCNDLVRMQARTGAAEKVTLVIADLLGRELWRNEKVADINGRCEFTVVTSELPHGVYVCVLSGAATDRSVTGLLRVVH